MSDQIPIGSPPAPPGRHAAPPGWYSDPSDRHRERYWDGWQWSRNTRVPTQVAPGQPAGWPLGPTGHPTPYPSAQRSVPGAGPSREPYPGPGSPDGSAWSGYRGYGLQPAPTTADGVPLAGWGARLLAALIDWIGVLVVSQVAAFPFSRPLYERALEVWRQSMAAAARGVPSTPPSTTELASTLTTSQQAMYVLVLCGIGLAYYTLMWRFRSATLGQLITGLRVVPVDRGRAEPGGAGSGNLGGSPGAGPRVGLRTPQLPWSSALARAVIWVLPVQVNAAFWLFTLLDGLWPLWNPRRQAIHDLAARTQVVRIR